MCIIQSYLFISALIAIVIIGGHLLIQWVMSLMRKEAKEDLDKRIKKLIEEHNSKKDEKEEIEGEHDRLREQILDKRDELRSLPQTSYERKMSRWMGIFERAMYIAFWFIGYKEFIGVWLVVKIVGNWPERASGRIDRFLIGTGLSVSIAVIVSWFIESLLVAILY